MPPGSRIPTQESQETVDEDATYLCSMLGSPRYQLFPVGPLRHAGSITAVGPAAHWRGAPNLELCPAPERLKARCGRQRLCFHR